MDGLARCGAGIGIIFAMCLLLIQLARGSGERLKPLPTFLEHQDCSLPCWQGVRPGESSMADFWQTLEAVRAQGGWMYSGFPSGLDESGASMTEFKLTLVPSQQIRLGDVLFAYGAPQALRVVQSRPPSRSRHLTTEAYLYWAEGHVQIIATQPDSRPGLTPDMWIRDIRMIAPSQEPLTLPGAQPWRGFGSALGYDER